MVIYELIPQWVAHEVSKEQRDKLCSFLIIF